MHMCQAPSHVPPALVQVLHDSETQACIKMLLRWQGCYEAEKMESDTNAVRECKPGFQRPWRLQGHLDLNHIILPPHPLPLIFIVTST